MKTTLILLVALAASLPASAQTYGGSGGVYFPPYNPPQNSGFLDGYRASRGLPPAPVYVNPPAQVYIPPAPQAPTTTTCRRFGDRVVCDTY